MTPNDQINNRPPAGTTGEFTAAKAASTICLLAGIWLFISPWIYAIYMKADAWNCWIVGGLMILFGIVRIARPAYSTILGWCNTILGIWILCSPWIYGYFAIRTGRFINSLCVGVIVFIFSIASVMISGNRNAARPV